MSLAVAEALNPNKPKPIAVKCVLGLDVNHVSFVGSFLLSYSSFLSRTRYGEVD